MSHDVYATHRVFVLHWYEGSFLLVITRSEVLSSYFIAAVLYFFLTRSHLSPNLAITVCVSFTVSVQTSIPKQLTPSPLPLFTQSLTTATLYHNLLKSQITRLQQIQNSLVRVVVKAPKSCHFTPIFWSLHWLKITECIEYKLLSLTYKVLTTTQPSYLHNLIQPPHSTRSSSLVTFARPSTSSSLRITDRSFQYASPRHWNQLWAYLRQPRTNLSNSDSPSSLSGTSSIGSIDSPLSSSTTSSLLHSRLKTFLFCKSFTW